MPERTIVKIEYTETPKGCAAVTLDNGDTLGLLVSVDSHCHVDDLVKFEIAGFLGKPRQD